MYSFSLNNGGLEYIQHRYISLNSHDFLNFLFTLITTEQRTFLKCFADSLSLLLCVFFPFYTIIIHFKFLKCFRTATLHYFYDYFYGYGVNWMISKMHCLYARKILHTLLSLYEFSLLYSIQPHTIFWCDCCCWSFEYNTDAHTNTHRRNDIDDDKMNDQYNSLSKYFL